MMMSRSVRQVAVALAEVDLITLLIDATTACGPRRVGENNYLVMKPLDALVYALGAGFERERVIGAVVAAIHEVVAK